MNDRDQPLPLIVCSVNSWQPKIRREHVMLDLAQEDGHAVAFIELARDIRALKCAHGRRAWLRGWSRVGSLTVDGSSRVRRTSTIVPAHQGGLAASTDTWRLRRVLLQEPEVGVSVVVATAPWQWPAVHSVAARRHVFDCGDDWASLIPKRRKAMARLYQRIGREADDVVVVSSELLAYFPANKTAVIANGVRAEMFALPLTPRPAARRMVYVGTLNERFDAPLVAEILRTLPEWRLDIFGGCAYAGHGTAPADELRRLLLDWRACVDDHPNRPAERRRWSEAHRWERRWDSWSRVLFG